MTEIFGNMLSKYTQLLINFFLYYSYYRKIKSLLNSRLFRTREQVERYQFRKLKELITYAYENTVYYRNLFDNVQFQPEDFKRLEDLKKIPYLTKEIIREHQDELISNSIRKKHIKVVRTGGTTGMPTEFKLDKRFSTLAEMVFLRHMWKRIGYRQWDRCVVLREDTVNRIVEGKKYWKRNLLTNWLIMSAFHFNKDTFDLYYKKIQSYKPRFILAFPSNVMLLASYIKDNNLSGIKSLKGVICASENLYNWQREYLSEVLQARVFSYYGHSEKCVLAPETSDSKSLEFYPQYGYAELVNSKNEYCSEEGERGEIIATGFLNFASPFIRYKTNDIALFTSGKDADHPHWFTIRDVEGRKQDFLIDRDHVPKTYLHIDRPFWNIRDKVFAYQYVQDKPGMVTLDIHPKQQLSDEEKTEIKRIFYETYFKFDLIIREVDHIPRTKGGKFRYLVQNIDTAGQ